MFLFSEVVCTVCSVKYPWLNDIKTGVMVAPRWVEEAHKKVRMESVERAARPSPVHCEGVSGTA